MENSVFEDFKSRSEVVFSDGKEWRKVKDTSDVYVSDYGDIIKVKNNRLHFYKPVKWHTTKGYYLVVKFNKKGIPVHKLVCEAFIEKPDSDNKLITNHKDGNKLNNRKDNLEWCTQSYNVQHGFNIGLCKAGVRVTATNLSDGSIHTWNSLSKFARDWNITRYYARELISLYRNKPYQKQWIFNTNKNSDLKLDRYQRVSIIYKDYLNNKIFIVNDIMTASFETHIPAGSIVVLLNRQYRKNRLELFAGYVFQKLDELKEWPSFNEIEAKISNDDYFSKRKKLRRNPLNAKFTLPEKSELGI